jgi:hypothetical protein
MAKWRNIPKKKESSWLSNKLSLQMLLVVNMIFLFGTLWINHRSLQQSPLEIIDDTPILQSMAYDPPPDFPFEVIHTVHTRFMVGQPNQPILARARYLLFATFCYPTMRYQTSQNFYWIVLADPRLDKSILDDLRNLLLPMPNAYLVLTSNITWIADGVGVPDVTTYGVGLQEIAEEYRTNNLTVSTGNVDRLKQFDLFRRRKGGDSSIILKMETNLDADDGLHKKAIELMQTVAVEHAKFQQNLLGNQTVLSLESTWWLFGASDQIEWHNRDIYTMTPGDYASNGISSGLAARRKNPTYPPSAGWTRVGTLQAPVRTIHFPLNAYTNHGAIDETQIPRCGGTRTFAGCNARKFPGFPLVMRTRSVTSDSMDHLDPAISDYRDVFWRKGNDLQVNEIELSWKILVDDFSIDRFKAWEASVYMYEHAHDIVKENKASRW